MSKTEQKNSNKGLVIFAIALIILTVIFSSIGYYAWAKYRSSIPGDATAQVAKWNFELRAGQNKDTEPTPFAITRTDGYGDVAEGTLAPGTFGSIPVYIDMTGTEVLTKLELTFTITDCPRNVKFYASEADRTNNKPMKITQTRDGDNKYVTSIEVTKYYAIEDETAENYVGKVHNETIYWKWAYETLDSENSSTAGDEIDKEDSGKEAQIVITAIATEALAKTYILEEAEIKVGDTINYTKGNTEIKGIVINKTDSLLEFMPVDNSTNKAKTVGSLTLGYKNETTSADRKLEQGIESWNNTEQLADEKAKEGFKSTYGFDGASRALAVEDVNRLVGYTPNPSTSDINGITYSKAPTSMNRQRFIVDELTRVTTQNGEKAATDLERIEIGSIVVIGNTYGGETVKSVTVKCKMGESTNSPYSYSDSTNYPLSTYFDNTYFWLASHCFHFYPDDYDPSIPDHCDFCARCCNSSGVSFTFLYNSGGGVSSNSHPVVPVVSLTSNIKVKTGATSGLWEINQ